jgi:carboxylesterase
MTGPWLWIPGVVAAIWAQRAWRAVRLAQRFRERHPASDDGIIIGAEPRTLAQPGSRALLLFHGYNDSPRSLESLAERIANAGWTVRLPLLPGHGRSLEAWDDWRADEVFAMARAEYAALRKTHSVVVVGGLSMGGALATWLAAESDADALVLFAPMLFIPRPMQVAVSTARLWSLVTRYLSGRGGRSIRDPEAQARMISYGCSTRRSLEALDKIANEMLVRLGFVHVPVLFVQSREDNRLPHDQSKRALARIASDDRTALWIEGAGHVLTVDYGWQDLADRTVAWLDARFPADRPPSRLSRG